MNKKVMLYCEFGTAHHDVMFSVMNLIKDEYEIHLLTNPLLEDRIPTSIAYASKKFFQTEGRASWKTAIEGLKHLKKIDPDIVFINTAQSNVVRDFLLMMPFRNSRGHKIEVRGIHHNAVKLINSFSQKLISLRLKKYLVLADYVHDNLKPFLAKSSISTTSFFPCYYEFDGNSTISEDHQQLIKNKIIIAIPGTVEQTRRDYKGLLKALAAQPPPEELIFAILGNSLRGDGPWLKSEVQRMGLQDSFIFFDGFVPNQLLFSWLSKSHVLAPLMHPGMDAFEDFSKFKITGTYSLSYGFQLPMIMHQSIHTSPYFKDISIGYEIPDLGNLLATLSERIAVLNQLKLNIKNDSRFNRSEQQIHLLQYLKSN